MLNCACPSLFRQGLASLINLDGQAGLLDEHLLDLYIYYAGPPKHGLAIPMPDSSTSLSWHGSCHS